MKNDDLQKKMIQFQLMELNLKALQERAKLLNEKIEEMENTKIAIEELENVKPSKTLIPLGSGNFIPGRIEDKENIIVGIGGGIAINKKRSDALAILNGRLKETENSLNDISTNVMKIALEMEKIQQELEESQK